MRWRSGNKVEASKVEIRYLVLQSGQGTDRLRGDADGELYLRKDTEGRGMMLSRRTIHNGDAPC